MRVISRCGWCKRTDLRSNESSDIPPGDRTLQLHTIPGTAKTICKGPETYRDTDANGLPGKANRSSALLND